MRQPFCILNVLGDMLDDGELHFVEAAQTLAAAKNACASTRGVVAGRICYL